MIRHKLNIIGVGRGTGTNLSRSRASREAEILDSIRVAEKNWWVGQML